ncbi:uncharacterized protein LOC131427394 [Malaya genurostris]|uniref:uncharacterized protein LOC131427394 n=1 Tax=Malaya genurostris TaxID=325434 RepID=UPI0026F3D537|nr:uncharacterized protein LOC131427394 [Malaya genurostris]
MEKGFRVNFVGSRCFVASAAGKTIALGEMNGKLFVLKTAEYAKICNDMQHLPLCQHAWHRRFGHREPSVLDKLKPDNLSVGFKMEDCGMRQICENCLKARVSDDRKHDCTQRLSRRK